MSKTISERVEYCRRQAAECDAKAQLAELTPPTRRAWVIAANEWYQEAVRAQDRSRKISSPSIAPEEIVRKIDLDGITAAMTALAASMNHNG